MVLLDGMSDFEPFFISRNVTSSAPDRAGRGGLGTWSWFPLPLFSSRAWTFHGEYLSPWLVKIARARKVTATPFAFSCLKRTGCMLLRSLSEWFYIFPDDRRSFSTRLKFPREKCRHPWCPKVVVGRYLSNNSCAESASKKRRQVVTMTEWVRWMKYRSTLPYFWPVVRIHLDLCVVCCMFRNWRVPVTVGVGQVDNCGGGEGWEERQDVVERGNREGNTWGMEGETGANVFNC